MARKTQPARLQQAHLSIYEMEAAIPKLRRRIKELEKFDFESIQELGDPRTKSLKAKIEDTLADIFSIDTLDYHRYVVSSLYGGSLVIGTHLSTSEIRQRYRQGFEQAVSKLRTAVDMLKEKIEDSGESPQAKTTNALGALQLHHDIERATQKLTADGHYANAVENGCKMLDRLVQMKSGRVDLSDTALMNTVFSHKNPILRFNSMRSDSDRSEQQGMMHLYAGAMLALRNPRAHGIIQDEPEQALEYIGFLSLLAKALDRTERI